MVVYKRCFAILLSLIILAQSSLCAFTPNISVQPQLKKEQVIRIQSPLSNLQIIDIEETEIDDLLDNLDHLVFLGGSTFDCYFHQKSLGTLPNKKGFTGVKNPNVLFCVFLI